MLNWLSIGTFYFKQQGLLLLYGTAKQLGVKNFEILYEISDQNNQVILSRISKVRRNKVIINKEEDKFRLKVYNYDKIKEKYVFITDTNLIKYYKYLNRSNRDIYSFFAVRPTNRNFLDKLKKAMFFYHKRYLLKKWLMKKVEFNFLELDIKFFFSWFFILYTFFLPKLIRDLYKNEYIVPKRFPLKKYEKKRKKYKLSSKDRIRLYKKLRRLKIKFKSKLKMRRTLRRLRKIVKRLRRKFKFNRKYKLIQKRKKFFRRIFLYSKKCHN